MRGLEGSGALGPMAHGAPSLLGLRGEAPQSASGHRNLPKRIMHLASGYPGSWQRHVVGTEHTHTSTLDHWPPCLFGQSQALGGGGGGVNALVWVCSDP